MNKDMIKNLHQAMLSTAAAALVSIGFMACSDETFVTQNSTVSADGYQVCISANIGGGDTRAIAYNDDTKGYDATFETTDLIYVYNVTKERWSWYKLNPDADGKSANLIGRLFFDNTTPEVNDELRLYYKSDVFNYSRDFARDDIADYALANVTITDVSDDGNITTSDAIFQNYQSVYKFKFTEIASDVKIKKLTISSGQNKLVSIYRDYGYYPNEFGSVTYVYKDEGIAEHELVCLLRFADNPNYNPDTESASGDELSFLALGSDGRYYEGTKSFTTDLKNGKYYHAEVAMEDAGLAVTLTSTTEGQIELSYRNPIYSKKAAYTAANVGYNTEFEWYGGENPLTLKNLTLHNEHSGILIFTDNNDVENTKMHHLILDGVNTIYSSNRVNVFTVENEGSLDISAASSGGKLIIEEGAMHVFENCTMTIKSGEVIANDFLYLNENARINIEGGVLTANVLEAWFETSRCVISKDGKLRIANDGNVREGLIKAASGYILNKTQEDGYTVYTVTEAPEPKDLSTATTADLGSIVCSDGKVYVPNCGLPEGVSPVAMIASISSTGHGLAIAMEAIRKNSDDYRNGFSWDNSGEANDGKTATEIFQNWATNNEVSFGTWRIPSKSDCQDMILGCRIDGDATVASDENMTSNGFGTKLVAAGICTDDYFYFGTWTSTSGQDGEIYLGTNKSENGSFVAGFYNYSFSSTTTIFPVLEF